MRAVVHTTSRLLVCLYTLVFSGVALAQTMPALLDSAREQDWQAVDALLAEGVDPNTAWGDGSTALHWAAYYDDLTAASRLLNAGARATEANDLGATPLWLAAENGSAAMTELLLAAGADPDRALLSGETPLMTATQAGDARVLRLLLKAGADPNVAVTRGQTALMWAASRGNGKAVAALLEHGADAEARSEVRRQYVKSEKEQDSHPAYKYWIEEGGSTALIMATRSGDLDSVRLLVEAGADIEATDAFGTSPLIMAVHGGNAEVVRTLLEQGADPDADDSGHTALHAAVLRGNPEIVAVLLAFDADVEVRLERPTPARRQTTDYNFHNALLGASPLWLAARFTEPEIMHLLIEAGADPLISKQVRYPAQRMGDNFMADEGEVSLLMAAVGMGHRRLRMSWGSPERRAGQTPLSHEDLVLAAARIAVAAGVDTALEDAEGISALDFARGRNLHRVGDYLDSLP